MMKLNVVVWVLVSCLAGCGGDKSPAKALTCADNPTGRSKAEQMEIGDACFRSGSYTKSPPRVW